MTQPTPLCCPAEPRLERARTRAGAEAVDVHRHKGLLRGHLAGERPRLLFWLANGRLSGGAETPFDLRRVG